MGGTLTEFASQLEQRRRKRNRRAREERRREKWIEVEENKRMGKYPDMKVRVESAFHLPQVGQDPQDPGLQLGSSNDTTDNDTFSFAKMLKSGVAKPSTWVMHLVQHGGQRARRKTGNGSLIAQQYRRPESTTSRNPRLTSIASRPLSAEVNFCACYAGQVTMCASPWGEAAPPADISSINRHQFET